MAGLIVALVPDLMAASRIEEAARRAGARVEVFHSQEDAAMRLSAEQPDLIIVDMSFGSVDMDAVAELGRLNNVPVVAYGPHVDVEGRQAAIRAGVAEVYTRGRFVQELPQIIGKYVQA